MKPHPNFVPGLDKALRTILPTELLRVPGAEIFAGTTPWSGPASIHCQVRGAIGDKPRDLVTRLGQRFGPENMNFDGRGMSDLVAALAAALLRDTFGLAFGHGAYTRDGEEYCWVEYLTPVPTLHALATSFLAVAEATANDVRDPAVSEASLAMLRQTSGGRVLNSESLLLIEAARRRDIPFMRLSDARSMWQFGWGSRSRLFWEMASNDDGVVAYQLSRNKDGSKRLFRDLGMPTAPWHMIGPTTDLEAAAKAVGFPCVVKPTDRGRGEGVTANLTDMDGVKRAHSFARRFSDKVMIEAHVEGDDHRLTTVDGKVVAVTQRRPSTVTGDGKSSVRALIAALNARRRAGGPEAGFLKPILEDAAMDEALARQGVGRDSVIEDGRTIYLRTNSNHSTGGTLHDLTDRMHPQVRAYAEQLSTAFGLRVCGIDYITPDIALPPNEAGAFIEINATPGVRGMSAAGIDEIAIASRILGDLPGRIEVTLVIAPEEAVEAIADRLAAQLGRREGLGVMTRRSLRLGEMEIAANGRSPSELMQSLLRMPTLDALIVIWSNGTLVEEGLPSPRLAQTVILGEVPAEPWHRLLTERSATLYSADNAEAAARAVISPAPATSK